MSHNTPPSDKDYLLEQILLSMQVGTGIGLP
jgi:hypothetical protein